MNFCIKGACQRGLAAAGLLLALSAPQAMAQSAPGDYDWGTWSVVGSTSTQPRYQWNGGSDYVVLTGTVMAASWANGWHSAKITTTQPDGFAMTLPSVGTTWGDTDNGPYPPQSHVYGTSKNLLSLSPNKVVQTITIPGGITADMVVGFYSVIPQYIKLAAYDAGGNPVSLLGVVPAFTDTSYTAKNALTMTPAAPNFGIFQGTVTPGSAPNSTDDSAFVAFTGFNPAITKIEVLNTRPVNDGKGRGGDGYGIYLGALRSAAPPPAPVPLLDDWGTRLMLMSLLAGGALLVLRRRVRA